MDDAVHGSSIREFNANIYRGHKMKRILAIAIVACALLPCCLPAQTDATTAASVRSQIEALLQEQMLAANAHDTDRFMATYLHDSSLVFVFNGVSYNGWDSLESQQLKWWNNGKSDVVYSRRGPAEFTVLSPTAVVVMQLLESRRTLATGAVTTSQFASTTIWQKRGREWKVVQGHESTVH